MGKLRISALFHEFFESEKTGGLLLVFCTFASILISNSAFGDHYTRLWQRPLDLLLPAISLKQSMSGWINDGLMTIFFLLVGLEIEREFYKGELAEIKHAALPVIAALGGMIVPAFLHLSFNAGTPTQSGFGIPMATDIAFSLAALSLLGNRVPAVLKVFLTALAIIDDLGAMLVIAFFYAHDFSTLHFILATMIFLGLVALNRLGFDNLFIYMIAGIVMWFFMLKSGVHATITGVLLAFVIPFRKGDAHSPSHKVQHFLDKPVPFIVLPLFALANTSIVFAPGWHIGLIGHNTLGILAGLLLGKPVGIVMFSLISVKIGLCALPDTVTWRHMIGMGMLGGIGFTMSIFITNLAFPGDVGLAQDSKLAILSASAIAGAAGFLVLLGAKRSTTPAA
jgi:Na+:H+ antiporter, NhaA family